MSKYITKRIKTYILVTLLFVFTACTKKNATVIFRNIKQSGYSIVSDTDSSDLVLKRKWRGNVCTFKLVNKGKKPIAVTEVILFDIKHQLPFSTEIYGEGFTMLSQTGGTLGRAVPIGKYTDRQHYKIPEPSNPNVVYNLLELKSFETDYCLMAFSSSNRFVGRFYISKENIKVSVDCENLIIGPGEKWELEEFNLFHSKTRSSVYSKLSNRIDKNHPGLKCPDPPTGWCSWYCFGPNVTVDQVRNNLQAIKNRGLELKYIQIDDGYQSAMGDWLQTSNKFGQPVDRLIEEIKAEGYEPAIWVAPFIAEEKSRLFKEHPDWFVKGEDGNPLPSNEVSFGGWRNAPWYALDGTHPQARDYLKHVFTVMKDQWGCKYFKLDANFWGAIHGGIFYNTNATRVEAYRQGMEAILETVGNDAFILGCNHPLWPSLGLIHGSRTSLDINRTWHKFEQTSTENLHRNWMNGKLWYNDPDCLLLTGNLTKDEYAFHASSVYATGGMLLSGDDITKLKKKDIKYLKSMQPISETPFVFNNNNFDQGICKTHKGFELCLLNRDEKIKTFNHALDHRYAVTDKWTGQKLGEFDTEYTTKLRPHQGTILIFEKVD